MGVPGGFYHGERMRLFHLLHNRGKTVSNIVDDVRALEGLLPPKVHEVLTRIAEEVDSHTQLLNAAASLAGPVGEEAAAVVEAATTAVEDTSTQVASTAHTEPSTDIGDEKEKALPSNYEQTLPYEQWPKSE